jgi:NAD+ synthase (glutamine-hydrolysing)
MLAQIDEAKKNKASLIIFPEMAVPGYLLGDTWEQRAFLKDAEYHGKLIIEAADGIAVIFGNVAADWQKKNNDGRVRKYNACFIAQNKQLVASPSAPYPFKIKTLQPNYREFDDTRHFYSLQKLARELNEPIEKLIEPIKLTLDGREISIGCVLCEDGWSDDYHIAPLQILHEQHHVDLFINISSSPYTLGKNNKRNRVFGAHAKKFATPIVYVNAAGIQNNGKTLYTFDGSSTVYNKKGDIIAYAKPYSAAIKYIDLDLENDSNPPLKIAERSDIAAIYDALHYGIKKFLHSIHMNKVVIGVSGGIDSAVAAALYTSVIGAENILLVNMPSKFNSKTTKDLSYQLAKNLGCNYAIMPIQEVVEYTVKQLEETPITNLADGSQKKLSVSSFVTENIQARDRSSRILAGMAAAFGGGFTCNANKAESTVGYSTLYGDQSGFLAALADLWKFQVYDLARYMNEKIFQREVVPQATIDIVPSAELSANQNVDEGKGDPIKYPYHDYLFRAFMEHWNRATPEDILEWYEDGSLEAKLGCEKGLVQKYFASAAEFIADLERWWNLYSGMAVAKRIQAPPVLAISRRAYGFDHREAQNGPYYTARYKKMKEKLLK